MFLSGLPLHVFSFVVSWLLVHPFAVPDALLLLAGVLYALSFRRSRVRS